MRRFPKGFGGERRDAEQVKRDGWREQGVLVVAGTTIVAAEQTGRRCYAMELSPQYVDVAVRRWQEFTGKEATLEATGATFAQVAEDKTNANAAA
jgi:hypothetical protein